MTYCKYDERHFNGLIARIDRLERLVIRESRNLAKEMQRMATALDDLKQAITDLSTQIDTNNAEIETLLTKITAPGTSDADVQAAVQQIRDITARNKAEVDKAVAAAP